MILIFVYMDLRSVFKLWSVLWVSSSLNLLTVTFYHGSVYRTMEIIGKISGCFITSVDREIHFRNTHTQIYICLNVFIKHQYLPNRVRMIKSRRLRWAGHVARIEESRMIKSRRLRWAGHVARMEEECFHNFNR